MSFLNSCAKIFKNCPRSLKNSIFSNIYYHTRQTSTPIVSCNICAYSTSPSRPNIIKLTTYKTGLRSFSCCCRSNWSNLSFHQNIQKSFKTCGCSIHTEGDKELVQFLNEEISLEQKSSKGQPVKFANFEITDTDGSEVVLTRKLDNEVITVKFNVNNSVDDESENIESAETTQNDPKMVSKPPFLVEISKGSDTKFAIQCSFPVDATEDVENPPQENEEPMYDIIEIQEVTFLKDDWKESLYSIPGGILDGNLYDLILNMLEERGIDGEFVDKLVEFSTNYEHKQYVNFLEQLKQFANQK